MVGFNRRYARLRRGARGVRGARPEACLALKNRPGTEDRATLENAIHMVDLLRWFCGEAVEVHGRAAFTDPYRETTAAATLRFDSGALAVLLANRSTSHWVERLEVFGHGRSAVVEAPDRVSLGQDGQARVTEMTPIYMGWVHVAEKLGFRQELEHFVECLRTRAEPRTWAPTRCGPGAHGPAAPGHGAPARGPTARLSPGGRGRRRGPGDDRGPYWPTRAALALLVGYQRRVSPLLPGACRFWPTCSEYARLALLRHGLIRGGALALWRLCRVIGSHAGGSIPRPEPGAGPGRCTARAVTHARPGISRSEGGLGGPQKGGRDGEAHRMR